VLMSTCTAPNAAPANKSRIEKTNRVMNFIQGSGAAKTTKSEGALAQRKGYA
jgi:hypothetical protein